MAEASQVEKVLEDLIARLTKSPSTPEIKAAIIEAKRLRTVTTRWSAIPPQPDARREMMARVTQLITRTGLSERDPAMSDPPPRREEATTSPPRAQAGRSAPPPPTRSAPPPRSGPPAREVSTPAPRRSVAPRATELNAPREEPVTPPTFRQFEELGETRPRALRPSGRPGREPPGSLPISQKPTVPPVPRALGTPQDLLGPPSLEPASPSRSITPAGPQRSLSPLPISTPRPSPIRALSPGPMRSMSPAVARPPPERSLSPAPAWRVNSPPAAEAARSGDSGKRAAQTMQFTSGFLAASSEARTPDRGSDFDSDPPPSRSKSTSPPPAPDLGPSIPTTPRLATSSSPPPLRRPVHRAATIAGIPEANEAMIAAALNRPLDGRTPPPGPAEPFEEVAKRSALPTLSPPGGPPSSAPPARDERKRSKETLMMGAYSAAEALRAVGVARPPELPSEFGDEDLEAAIEPPPSTKPSNPPESTPAVLGIGAPAHGSGDRIEGLSTKISRTNLQPVPPPRITQRPPPARREATLQPQSQPQRVLVAPGISIAKPGTAVWQPHPTLPNVSQKVVYREPRTGLYAALVKLAPGAVLPRRRHLMTEEVFVVSGLAQVDGHIFEAGDYLRAEADTIHPAMSTKNGCTLFMIAGEHDEILDDD